MTQNGASVIVEHGTLFGKTITVPTWTKGLDHELRRLQRLTEDDLDTDGLIKLLVLEELADQVPGSTMTVRALWEEVRFLTATSDREGQAHLLRRFAVALNDMGLIAT